ncbi:MAG: Omp28-related outer membrane protein [Bernardetiaceae bacterium]|nr:Omp28-related outer membrane protein [Bernardetiaceae bacterium]
MKHVQTHFIFLLIALFLFASCGGGEEAPAPVVDTPPDEVVDTPPADDNQDDEEEQEEQEQDPFDIVPSNFTKKVVLEQLTGAWCGWCPGGSQFVNELAEEHPERFIGVAIHGGDRLENATIIGFIDRTFSISGYPSALINRERVDGSFLHFRNTWVSLVERQLRTRQAPLGMAIKTERDEQGKYKLTANVGFTEAAAGGTFVITAYVVEDGITGIAQRNYYSNNANFRGHPYHDKPDPIRDYVFNRVARFNITDMAGVSIPANMARVDRPFTLEQVFDVPSGIRTQNASVVVIITERDTRNRGSIVNAQIVKLGETKLWD